MSEFLPPLDGEGRHRRGRFYLATITDPGELERYFAALARLHAARVRRNAERINAAAGNARAIIDGVASQPESSVGVPRVVRVDRQPDSDQPG